ncbi:uncharacterized protein LOC130725428 [Lotus japonicus]|uniref:uncharacterized protein LOC130725428 n=1 Tax=Lotus japonicus TaxID=34305 RepID=UPI002585C2B4|nr:uncharacterized protein LOC130725428 [Lotus japonicus]
MKMKLAGVWRLDGDFELLDVGNGFFMVKFDIKEDRDKVIGGGPWRIFDHYIAVSMWNHAFVSPAAKVDRTLAWIRIPGLNVAFYDESFLMLVTQVIGTPIRVDINTLQGDRGRFARICVELDLTKPIFGKIMIEDFWYNIEYEGLHIICTKCGCYGHRSRECIKPASVVLKSQLKEGGGGESTMASPENLASATESTPPESSSPDPPTEGSPMQSGNEDMEMETATNLETNEIGGAVTESEPRVVNANLKIPLKAMPPVQIPEEVFRDWMTVSKRKSRVGNPGGKRTGETQTVVVKGKACKGLNANDGVMKTKKKLVDKVAGGGGNRN